MKEITILELDEDFGAVIEIALDTEPVLASNLTPYYNDCPNAGYYLAT